MLGFFKLTALFFVSSVVAQSTTSSSANSAAVPTSTAGIDACITTCSQQAATQAGCVSFTNVTCVCTSQQFQTAALACLQANCTASELQTAQGIQSSICGASASGSGSGSGSGPAGPTATGPGPISLSSTASISGTSGSPSVSQVSTTSGSGSSSTSAPASTSSGASVGKYAYAGVFGKELGALVVAGVGAILGGALLL